MTTQLADVIGYDTRANQPTPTTGTMAGALYFVTDEFTWERWSGTAWETADSAADPDHALLTYIDFITAAAPSNPSAGHVRVYSKTGSHIAQRDSAGTETLLDDTGGGGGGGISVPIIKQSVYGGNSATTLTFAAIGAGALLAVYTNSTTGQCTSPTMTGVTWIAAIQGNNGTGYYTIWFGVDSGSGGATAFSITKPGSFNTMVGIEIDPASLGYTVTPTAGATVDRNASGRTVQPITGLTAGKLVLAARGQDNTGAASFLAGTPWVGFFGNPNAGSGSAVNLVAAIAPATAMSIYDDGQGNAGRFNAVQIS